MGRAWLSAAGAVALIAVLPATGASPVGRKTLGGRGFATDVTVSFTAPQGYRILGGGYENWRGPPYTRLETGSTGQSSLHFDVHPNFDTRSPQRAIRDKLGADMGGIPTREVASGPIDVPHVVRGRKVGVVKGVFVIRQATSRGYEGWYEGGVAFGVGTGYPVLAADVDTTSPDADASKRIEGMQPSKWNRQAIEQGIRGTAVEGNLAPRRVVVRIGRGLVAGRATDSLGHPLVAARVVLERRAGAGWSRAATGRTGLNGEFSLRLAGAAGVIRVSVSSGGAVARSKALTTP